MSRRAKIVCTLGPATSSQEQITSLVESGMDVARLNFSHGAHADHEIAYKRVREASDLTGHAVAILADLQGPKIRLGTFAEGPVVWETGSQVCITVEDVPGTRLTYEGQTGTGGGIPHRVIFTVTDFTKEVDGVRTRVVYDVDESDGEVVEAELAFFAQDDAGNVWSLGEYPEEYEDGTFIGAPDVWIAGLEGASAGIHMPADAEELVRGPEYLQGEAPAIDFLDCARVAKEDGTVQVPAGDFHDVLTTHERSPLESTSAIQIKEHAEGVGIVRISARTDPEGETLELVSVEQLTGPSLRAVDDAVVRLDENGRRISDVYRGSSELRRSTEGRP